MSVILQLPLMLLLSQAQAAEVVWLAAPSDEDRALVADAAGATGAALAPIDLRAAAAKWSPTDDAAYKALDSTLTEVRGYETSLDGELLIMRDLDTPIRAITVVRDASDRDKLYAALAYQGFAVNRYFDMTLGEDDEAEPYRVVLEGAHLERPWLDAVALDPERKITPYDIAEAPQRIIYGQVAEKVQAALPGSIEPVDFPADGTLFVDGREAQIGPAGNVKVVPGRHLVHAEVEGQIVERWDLRLDPGESLTIRPALSEKAWQSFFAQLADGVPVPEALLPSLKALGGEVWIAQPGEKLPTVFAIDGEGVRAVTLERPKTAPSEDPSSTRALSWSVAGMMGWFYSGDFYTQDPVNAPHTVATVNAGSAGVHLGADYQMGAVVIGAGLDWRVTFGEHHFALTGEDGRPRPRTYPHLAVGLAPVQATLGYLFPYHPGVGAQAQLPIGDPLELRASALLGLPSTLDYDSGGQYQTQSLAALDLGLGLRF